MSIDPEPAMYEYRAFDLDLTSVRQRWLAHDPREETVQTAESYIVTRLNIDVGVKVRDGVLEVKELLSREGLLEKWQRTMTMTLPVDADLIGERVGPLLGVDLELAAATQFDEAALKQLVAGIHALSWVTLDKTRTLYRFSGVICETVDIKLGGVVLQSAAVTAEDPQRALQAVEWGGFETRDNESYPSRLQRLLSL